MLRFVEHDGVRFACELRIGEGSGEPGIGDGERAAAGGPMAGGRGSAIGAPWLILLHGLGGDRSQVIELAPAGAPLVMAMDFRGHGETEPLGPPEKLGFRVFASDLAAVMDALRIECAVVAGVSMGAGVAARLALDFPGKVKSIACIRPAWLDRPFPDNLAGQPLVAGLLRSHGPEAGLAAFRRSAVRADFAAVSTGTAESLDGQFLAPGAVARAARLERLPADAPFADMEELRSVGVPALVAGCERDPMHPLHIADEWAARLRTSTVLVPPKAEDAAAYTAAVRRAIAALLA